MRKEELLIVLNKMEDAAKQSKVMYTWANLKGFLDEFKWYSYIWQKVYFIR